jgi:hypothetical protein
MPAYRSRSSTAFQIHRKREIVNAAKGKHLAADAEDKGCFIEGKIFGNAFFCEAMLPEFIECHVVLRC